MQSVSGVVNEEWRPVVGFEGVYEVSDQGRVRRIKGGKGVAEVGKVMTPWGGRGDYPILILSKGGGSPRKTVPVHRLVAEAFLGPRPTPEHQVNHINADRADPRLVNLEYVTRRGNMQHAVRLGTIARGSRQGSARLREEDIPRIRALFGLVPDKQIAAWFGVGEMTISNIKLKGGWSHVKCNLCCPEHCPAA